MGQHPAWELVFFLVILKIPIVYLGFVVWYAIKAVPTPEEGASVTVLSGPNDEGPRRRRGLHPRHLLPRPHGAPSRTYPRAPRTAVARTRTDQDVTS